MNKQLKLLFILGTRPEAIKLFPLIRYTSRHADYDLTVCNSGQHKDLLDPIIHDLDIQIDYDLGVMTDNQTPVSVGSKLLPLLSKLIDKVNPALVVVQGDTATALYGAMAAYYSKVPVAHIEAGLRTTDKYEPFPEEMNRRIISQIAALHFCPTEKNLNNLTQAGISEQVYVTGNTGLDAVRIIKEGIDKGQFPQALVYKEEEEEDKYIVVTMHRRENIGAALAELLDTLIALSEEITSHQFLIITHPNPSIKNALVNKLGGTMVRIIDPVPYPSMIKLLSQSTVVITDSGGLQEECTYLGIPVIVIRNQTERTEALELGHSIMSSPNKQELRAIVLEILSGGVKTNLSLPSSIYGDGFSSKRIMDIISGHLTKKLNT